MELDLLSFEYGVVIPSPYFNLEDELFETKNKLQRLEAKYKKNKDRTKQRWKQMEERMNRMEETVLKLKEQQDKRLKQLEDKCITIEELCDDLSDKDVSIIPCIDPNGKLQLYDVHCSEIKITNMSLSMDGKSFCDLSPNKDLLRFLKQNRYMESIKIELTTSYNHNSLNTIVEVCDTLLYDTYQSPDEKPGLEVWLKCLHMDNSLHIIQKMINLFKKSKKDETIHTLTIELEYLKPYQREIDEMKAHCTANDINFIFKEFRRH